MNFLPGWNPAFITGAKLTTITQALSATSTNSATITAPSGILAGDLIVMLDLAAQNTTPTSVVPSGFSSIADIFGTNIGRMVASYKRAVGTEGGTSITGMSTSGFYAMAKAIYVFRGNVPANNVSLVDADGIWASGNPTAQTVTSSGGTPPLVVLGFYGVATNGGRVNPRTFTVAGSAAKDGELNALHDNTFVDSDIYIAYKIYNFGATPADCVIDMDDEGENALASCYIQLS